MIHISVSELALTCGVILLLLILPLMWKRFSARMDQRLKNIEKKIEKKR